jgi:hypothetical protein
MGQNLVEMQKFAKMSKYWALERLQPAALAKISPTFLRGWGRPRTRRWKDADPRLLYDLSPDFFILK